MRNNSAIKVIKSFEGSWVPLPPLKMVAKHSAFKKMRDMQREGFEQLKDENLMIINAPTASGKSSLICLLSEHKMLKRNNKALKTIIAVPQKVISSGFVNTVDILFPDGTPSIWRTDNNLCAENTSATTKSVIKFLELPSDKLKLFLNQKTLVCTHATLAAVYRTLSPNPVTGTTDRRHLLKNLCVWFDEAHHIKNNDYVTEFGDYCELTKPDQNELGKLVTYLLDHHKSDKIKIGLTTATLFRGDRCTLLTEKQMSLFSRYDYSYERFFKSLLHLQSFSFKFILSGSDYIPAIEQLLKAKRCRDIIHIPHTGSKFSSKDKKNECKRIDALYRKYYGKKVQTLDLVNDKLSPEEQQTLTELGDKTVVHTLDAIVAMNKFREGATWEEANRSIIVGPRGSLTDELQIAGRLFRDFPGKSNVEINQILPFSLDQTKMNEEEYRQNLNKYMNCIFQAMMLEDLFLPVKIKVPVTTKTGKTTGYKTAPDYLGETNLTSTQIAELRNEFGMKIAELADVHGSRNVDELFEEFLEETPEILESYGIDENHEEIARQIWFSFSRHSLQMKGLKIDTISFDSIQKMLTKKGITPANFFLSYTSGMCGGSTFRDFRNAMGKIILPYEKAREFIQSLGLTGQKEFLAWRHKNLDKGIPADPAQVYKHTGWISWGIFLTSNFIPQKSFTDAREFVRSLRFKNVREFENWITENTNTGIPVSPYSAYKDKGWIDFYDFFGTPRPASILSFTEARKLVRSLKFKGIREFDEWRRKNLTCGIPASISKVYKNEGWISFNDFLGKESTRCDALKSFEDARKLVRSLHFKSTSEFRGWRRENIESGIPANPDETYATSGWKDWYDFLGTERPKGFLPFKEARKLVQSLGLTSQPEFHEWKKMTPNNGIPFSPHIKYANSGWIDYNDFLGKTK